MMRKEAFSTDVESFAASRKGLLASTDERLQPHVKDALRRVGLPSWQTPLVRAALEVFDETAHTEIEEWDSDVDTMRNEFERELAEALEKTKKATGEEFDKQVERVTKWVSVMAINAGTEAATTTDPDPAVGLEWVTMEDDAVRPIHKAVQGQQVRTGKPFHVNGVEMMYPGQPVGDPENWINCRCVARPAMLGGAAMSLTSAEEAQIQGIIAAATAPVEEEVDVPVADAPVEEVAEAPMIPDEEAAVQIAFHGVAAPEGIMSGDGRQFGIGALTNRPLPLSLMSKFVNDDGHKGSAISGRIDKLWVEDNLMKYEGVFDMGEAGYETIRLIADGMWRGVSVDVDQAVGGPIEGGTEYSQARVSGLTVCPIPAFAEAYIALGTWADETATPVITEVEAEATAGTETFDIPPAKTMDGPGWITEPVPTHRITSYWVSGPGRVKIGWGVPGDFNRCRVQLGKYVQNPEWLAGLCANLHYRALGVWPGRPLSGDTVTMHMDEKAETPSVNLTASAGVVVSADYFRNPNLTKPTGLTVTDDGRVFGHIAAWNVCHIANPEGDDICTLAPKSATDYAYFLSGEYVTDEGRVPVGQISLGGGHADGKLGMRAALAHYDNTSTAVADITCGNDEFGIWFSGKLRDGVTDSDIVALRAAGKVSGDWRGVTVGGQHSLELMAALAVNVPGFPIPRTTYAMEGTVQLSLTAAGIPAAEDIITPEFIAQMDAYAHIQERKNKIAELKSKARTQRADLIKNKISKAKEK